MTTELSQLTEAERVKILQSPSEAAPLQPPKPLFTHVGALSGANAETRSFEARMVPRDLAGVRDLIKSLGVRLTLEVQDPETGQIVAVDVTLTGLPDEWPEEIRRSVDLLKTRSDTVRHLKQFRRNIDRDPPTKRGFIEHCRTLRLTAK